MSSSQLVCAVLILGAASAATLNVLSGCSLDPPTTEPAPAPKASLLTPRAVGKACNTTADCAGTVYTGDAKVCRRNPPDADAGNMCTADSQCAFVTQAMTCECISTNNGPGQCGVLTPNATQTCTCPTPGPYQDRKCRMSMGLPDVIPCDVPQCCYCQTSPECDYGGLPQDCNAHCQSALNVAGVVKACDASKPQCGGEGGTGGGTGITDAGAGADGF